MLTAVQSWCNGAKSQGTIVNLKKMMQIMCLYITLDHDLEGIW